MIIRKFLVSLTLCMFMISCNSSSSNNGVIVYNQNDSSPQENELWSDFAIHAAILYSNVQALPDGDLLVTSGNNILVFDKNFQLKQAIPISREATFFTLIDDKTFACVTTYEIMIFNKINNVWVFDQSLIGSVYSFRSLVVIDSNTMATSASDKDIKIWKKNENGKWEAQTISSSEVAVSLAVIDENTLVSGSTDGFTKSTIKIWENKGDVWEVVQTIEESGIIRSLITMDKGKTFVSGSNKFIKVWEKNGEKWEESEKINTDAWVLSLIDKETIVSSGYKTLIFWKKIGNEWTKEAVVDTKINGKVENLTVVDSKTVIANPFSVIYKIEKIDNTWEITKEYKLHEGIVHSFASVIPNQSLMTTGRYDIILWNKIDDLWQKSVTLTYPEKAVDIKSTMIDNKTIASISSSEFVIWRNNGGNWEIDEKADLGKRSQFYANNVSSLVVVDKTTLVTFKDKTVNPQNLGWFTEVKMWKKLDGEWKDTELCIQNGIFKDAIAVNGILISLTDKAVKIWEKDGDDWQEVQTIDQIKGFSFIKMLTDSSFVISQDYYMYVLEKADGTWNLTDKVYTGNEFVKALAVADSKTILLGKENNVFVWEKTDGKWTKTKTISLITSQIYPVQDGFLFSNNNIVKSYFFE